MVQGLNKGLNKAGSVFSKGPSTFPFQGFLPYLPFILAGFAVADLGILSIRDLMLPTQAPPSRSMQNQSDQMVSRGTYNVVTTRNIFSADGIIPDPLVGEGQEAGGKEPEAVPSQLPLALMGTIVHSNPEKSIANIEIKGKNIVMAFTPKKEIDNLATLVKVERNKAIIRNANNGRLEFIEIKTNIKISFNSSVLEAPPGASTGNQVVKQTAPNKFEVSRADLNKYLSDVSSLLMQASSQPRKKPNGEIECFQITAIQPGSVYTQLGIMNGDCIKSVNGEAIDSPAKALELYNALKNSSSIKMTVERDGRDAERDYTVK